MTPEQLAKCTGATLERATRWLPVLTEAMEFYQISTPQRQAAFLAQVGHESGGLRYTTEIWGPTPTQQRYEGRADLGNTEPGDGYRYRGRGLLQTTGRANYVSVRNRLLADVPHMNVPDFVQSPDELATPLWAAYSACDYWDMRNLNDLADAGNFTLITRRINGGQNGKEHREALYTSANQALQA